MRPEESPQRMSGVHSLPGESELPRTGKGAGVRTSGAFELMSWAATIARSLGRGSASLQREAPRWARDEYRVSASQRPSLPACWHS
jgi:hypothetical protein